MASILQWDYFIFDLIHNHLQHPFLDAVLPYWRDKFFWLPLYLFIFGFLVINYKKQGWLLTAGLLITLGLADMTSSQILKPNIDRVRPCHLSPAKIEVRELVPCGGTYSFPSNHATNHFLIATFLSCFLIKRFRFLGLVLFLWAGSICYGQIYVGKHYPLDILGGMILGVLFGIIGYNITKYFLYKIK